MSLKVSHPFPRGTTRPSSTRSVSPPMRRTANKNSWTTNHQSPGQTATSNNNAPAVVSPDSTQITTCTSIPASHSSLIQAAFGSNCDLYRDVLGTPPSASSRQLRIAYFRQGRHVLTSSQQDTLSEAAKLKFQAVSMAYEIVSNPQWKATYDQYGWNNKYTKPPRAKSPPILRSSEDTKKQLAKIRWNEQVEELVFQQDPAEKINKKKKKKNIVVIDTPPPHIVQEDFWDQLETQWDNMTLESLLPNFYQENESNATDVALASLQANKDNEKSIDDTTSNGSTNHSPSAIKVLNDEETTSTLGSPIIHDDDDDEKSHHTAGTDPTRATNASSHSQRLEAIVIETEQHPAKNTRSSPNLDDLRSTQSSVSAPSWMPIVPADETHHPFADENGKHVFADENRQSLNPFDDDNYSERNNPFANDKDSYSEKNNPFADDNDDNYSERNNPFAGDESVNKTPSLIGQASIAEQEKGRIVPAKQPKPKKQESFIVAVAKAFDPFAEISADDGTLDNFGFPTESTDLDRMTVRQNPSGQDSVSTMSVSAATAWTKSHNNVKKVDQEEEDDLQPEQPSREFSEWLDINDDDPSNIYKFPRDQSGVSSVTFPVDDAATTFTSVQQKLDLCPSPMDGEFWSYLTSYVKAVADDMSRFGDEVKRTFTFDDSNMEDLLTVVQSELESTADINRNDSSDEMHRSYTF